MIEPLGFKLNEKALKRAGMDYWNDLDVTTYIDYQDFLEKNPGVKIYMATTKAHKVYTDVEYEPDCYIITILFFPILFLFVTFAQRCYFKHSIFCRINQTFY